MTLFYSKNFLRSRSDMLLPFGALAIGGNRTGQGRNYI